MTRVAGLQAPAIGDVFPEEDDLLDQAMTRQKMPEPYKPFDQDGGALYHIGDWPVGARDEVLASLEARGISLNPPKDSHESVYGRTPPVPFGLQFRRWQAALSAVVSEVGQRYGLTSIVNTTISMQENHLTCERCRSLIDPASPRISTRTRGFLCQTCAKAGSVDEQSAISLVTVPKGRPRKEAGG